MKNIEKGMTRLELFMALILVVVLAVSIAQIRAEKAKQEPLRECRARQWQWLPLLNEMEETLREWESVAGECLRTGLRPAQLENSSGLKTRTILFRIQDRRVGQIPKTPSKDLWVCEPERHYPGVSRTRVKEGFSPGSIFVETEPIFYDFDSEDGRLTRREGLTSMVLASGLDSFFLWLRPDASKKAFRAQIHLRKGSCEAYRSFHLLGAPPSKDAALWDWEQLGRGGRP